MTEANERRQADWSERVEHYAREAVTATRPFAAALVALVDPPPGARLLDVATGPGTVAVLAAQRTGPDGSVLATDFIPDWEPYLVAAAHAAGVTNVSYATMPAGALDLPGQSFDVALCQFGLMFVPDPLQALREMRRVLRPGGTLGIAVWSVPEKVGLFLMSRALGAALPPPPGDSPPSPTSMGEPGLIEGLVRDAGFHDLTVERVIRFQESPEPEIAWRQWSEASGSPASRGLASLSDAERNRLRIEVITALEGYRQGNLIAVSSEAILLKAVK